MKESEATKIKTIKSKRFYNDGRKVICPYTRKQCITNCPLSAITNTEPGKITFFCGIQPLSYPMEGYEERNANT